MAKRHSAKERIAFALEADQRYVPITPNI